MTIEPDTGRELTSEFIPDEMVFSFEGQDQRRKVHSARVNQQECRKCNRMNAEIWEFKLYPLTQHPNYLFVHRGEHSCGFRAATIDPLDMDSWVIKEQ